MADLGKQDKALYQPWREEAFSADDFVNAMTPLQRWMYRTLLQKAFVCSTRPYLPSDDANLWRLAGCENRQQWAKNKDAVLEMFTPVENEGKSLLAQKRVLEDWERLLDRRQALAKRGQSGGLAKGKLEPSASLAREVKGSEVKESEEKEQRAVSAKVSLNKQVPIECRRILGVRLGPYAWDNVRAEFTELADIYGSAKVFEAFCEWAESHAGEDFGNHNPLFAFLKVADGMLRGIIAVSEREDLKTLNAKLYDLGGQAFTGKYQHALGLLLRDYTPAQVEMAYKEFISERDDFAMKTAAKDFAEGGALAVLMAQKTRLEEAAREKALLDRERERRQQEVDAEAAAQTEADRLESELNADTDMLFGGGTSPQDADSQGAEAPVSVPQGLDGGLDTPKGFQKVYGPKSAYDKDWETDNIPEEK